MPAECGAQAGKHGDRVDYLHDGRLHHQMGDDVEEHVVEVSAKNRTGARRSSATRATKPAMPMGLAAGMRRLRMATTSTISSRGGSIIRTATITTITARSTSSRPKPEASAASVRLRGFPPCCVERAGATSRRSCEYGKSSHIARVSALTRRIVSVGFCLRDHRPLCLRRRAGARGVLEIGDLMAEGRSLNFGKEAAGETYPRPRSASARMWGISREFTLRPSPRH